MKDETRLKLLNTKLKGLVNLYRFYRDKGYNMNYFSSLNQDIQNTRREILDLQSKLNLEQVQTT